MTLIGEALKDLVLIVNSTKIQRIDINLYGNVLQVRDVNDCIAYNLEFWFKYVARKNSGAELLFFVDDETGMPYWREKNLWDVANKNGNGKRKSYTA